jgi:hypothetical protein
VIQFKSKEKELTVRLPLAAFTTPPDTGASTKTKSCPSPENHTHRGSFHATLLTLYIDKMYQDVSTLCSNVWKETHHWKTPNPTHITISSEEKKDQLLNWQQAGVGLLHFLFLLSSFVESIKIP